MKMIAYHDSTLLSIDSALCCGFPAPPPNILQTPLPTRPPLPPLPTGSGEDACRVHYPPWSLHLSVLHPGLMELSPDRQTAHRQLCSAHRRSTPTVGCSRGGAPTGHVQRTHLCVLRLLRFSRLLATPPPPHCWQWEGGEAGLRGSHECTMSPFVAKMMC